MWYHFGGFQQEPIEDSLDPALKLAPWAVCRRSRSALLGNSSPNSLQLQEFKMMLVVIGYKEIHKGGAR